MPDFLEIISQNAKTHKDKVILADDIVKGVTCGGLYEMSGKIAAYLKSKGVGKEDFVLICLPRGVQPVISFVGVLRAGAAFVIVEDNYAPERIEFIRQDCGCKLVLDESAWEEAQRMQPMEGYEPRDPHDAAFAVYTSGTTGNPKGVLHEYGNLERMIVSCTMTTCDPLADPDDRFALVAPLNFIASMLVLVYGLVFMIYNYIVSYATVKNPMLLVMLFLKNKITGTFLTPSYIRKMKTKPPVLKFCIIGSEPANGVWLEGLKIHNFYLMSESGFALTHFLIDRYYDSTPVGNSECGYEILLLDENGQPVADGQEGEICVANPFVRGYINLPEQTKEAFRDGIYHTGDLAVKDKEGRFIICGRLSDMVKINGNRVEPGEIEGVARKVLGVDWTAARIFDDGKRVFICVYYTDKIKVDFEETRRKMGKYLPYYMLPSFFIHIDSVPTKATGKMDRKALPAPVFEDYKDNYVEPRDDVEKALCKVFSEVLQIPHIGIKDDFYQLGGDSMGSLDVVATAGLPGLTASDIFRGHTPEKIAELYKEHMVDGESADEINDESIKLVHPLTPEQTYMVDYQLFTPFSTMYNLYKMVKFDKEIIDMQHLADVTGAVIRNHPALQTKLFFNEDGEIVQQYCEELFEEVKVEHVTEKELEEIKKTLVQPHKIINSRLIRCRVFETEEAGYLFMDIHHTIFDGTSSKVFFGNIYKAYAGMDVSKDYYYRFLAKREKQYHSDFYQKSRDYFENRYSGTDWCKRLTMDKSNTRENEYEEIHLLIPAGDEQLEHVEEKYGLSRNGFFVAATALACALYERKDDVMVSWIYNGRNDMNDFDTVGLMFRNLPVGICFRRNTTLKELYADVMEQINQGITYDCYPYVEGGSRAVEDDIVCVLYQGNLRSVDETPGLLDELELADDKQASQNLVELEIQETPEGLILEIGYTASCYLSESMERYGRIFGAVVTELLEYTGEEAVTLKKLVRKISSAASEGGFLSKNWWLSWMR